MFQRSGVAVGVGIARVGAGVGVTGVAGTSEGGAGLVVGGGVEAATGWAGGRYPTNAGGTAGRGSRRTWSSVSLRAGVAAATTEGVAVGCAAGVAPWVWEWASSVDVAVAVGSRGRCDAPAIVP